MVKGERKSGKSQEKSRLDHRKREKSQIPMVKGERKSGKSQEKSRLDHRKREKSQIPMVKGADWENAKA